jgi:hypothetical protein
VALDERTEPLLPSFLKDSQTVTASLISPRTVENSATCLCCGGGPDPGACERWYVFERVSTDDDVGMEGTAGATDIGVDVSKSRRVEENKGDGSRGVDEYS